MVLTHETGRTRGDNLPGIALSTYPVVDIEVKVPCVGVYDPVETLDLLQDGLDGEDLEAEEKTEGIGPVHRRGDKRRGGGGGRRS